ncbi:MAG TPA: phage holin family protein [Rubrivivax sp.]|nr:phage holin family protein [Burkholderiales bacterium]HNU11294.1 phage holin family protein [Rubrivivax sp.]
MTEPAAGRGLLRSVRRLADTALDTAQVRLALLGTELEQEKQRIFDALLRAAIGLLVLGLALLLAIGFLLLMLQEAYRLPALGVLTLLFGVLAYRLLKGATRSLSSSDEGPFALSLAELRRDRERIGARRERDPGSVS